MDGSLIVATIAVGISVWSVYQSPIVQRRVSKEWEREKLKHLVTADHCSLQEKWMENLRNSVDEFIESVITIASMESDGGPAGKGIPAVEVRKLYGRVEAKYMRVMMYFPPEDFDKYKLIIDEMDKIIENLKSNTHNVNLEFIRERRSELVFQTRKVLHAEWNEIQKKMNVQAYFDFEDKFVG